MNEHERRDQSYEVTPIGGVESTLLDPAEAPKQGTKALPQLGWLFTRDHLIVLTWLHRARREARGDQQKATRLRIIRATAELHDELGPARTTVSEIARRAGVQRLTVYNHFPEETDLFEACGAHWMAEHPLPDMSAAFVETDPSEGLRQVSTGLYGWYRENKASNEHLQRDRLLMPALDAVMRIRMDQQMVSLATMLAGGFRGADDQLEVRAAVALALDFWTWRRLSQEGMTDSGAAAVMANAVRTAGEGRSGIDQPADRKSC